MALEPRAKVIQQTITQPGASPKGCVNFDPAVTSYRNEILFRNVQGCALRGPMKSYKPFLLLSSPLAVSGCQMIGDIFKAGVWTGVVLVVAVVGIVIWLIARSFS
jgi:hypothetical protein